MLGLFAYPFGDHSPIRLSYGHPDRLLAGGTPQSMFQVQTDGLDFVVMQSGIIEHLSKLFEYPIFGGVKLVVSMSILSIIQCHFCDSCRPVFLCHALYRGTSTVLVRGGFHVTERLLNLFRFSNFPIRNPLPFKISFVLIVCCPPRRLYAAEALFDSRGFRFALSCQRRI